MLVTGVFSRSGVGDLKTVVVGGDYEGLNLVV